MGAAYDIAINMGSAAAGGGLAFGIRRGVRRWRYRSDYAFWSFLKGPTVFVMGRLDAEILMDRLPLYLGETLDVPERDNDRMVEGLIDYLRASEDSGLIGVGDLRAMIDMIARLVSLKLLSRPSILHPSEIGERRKENLVLVGGSDVNPMTENLAARMNCQFVAKKNEQFRNLVKDERLGSEYLVEAGTKVNENGERITRDFGVLAMGPNPENRRNTVLIVAGAQGQGTMAAARVCVREDDLKVLSAEARKHPEGFESLVSYTRIEVPGSPRVEEHIQIEFTRGLNSGDPG